MLLKREAHRLKANLNEAILKQGDLNNTIEKLEYRLEKEDGGEEKMVASRHIFAIMLISLLVGGIGYGVYWLVNKWETARNKAKELEKKIKRKKRK